MKILHITDSHGTVKSPESRTDVYYLSFLKKMYELKYVIAKEKINLIIHTGDLFHSPKVSDKFAGQLAEIIKSYGIPMYVVPGNHDIEGYNISTLDQTKLGLLYKTGVVKELDRDKPPIQLKSQKENLCINIVGQEYYKDIDTGNMADFEMRVNNNADFNILAIHGYLCDKPQHPSIRFTECKNIITDADVILSGHFHESFVYQGQDFCVYNPGSLMRVEQTDYNKNKKPQYGILEINNNNGVVSHTYTLHEFQIAEDSDKVFDYNAKIQKKKTLITLDNFKNSIANTNLNGNLNVSIEQIIEDVAKNLSVTQDVIDKTTKIYHDALNNSPDKLEIQQGFISDTTRKIIDNVCIENFQSHENTTIQFKDGLNAIIGKSNSGKTSILRAIRWALDNDPHGSDFITTGKEECKVTVNFTDGTQIVRKRTRTDAGEYTVIGKTVQPDGTVNMWNDTYKGFANNVPVEIANIHQMPKINLTKDICTHLNMMSQLDGPFLVTESPQVKAAIIGRLTGTQIIDLGIKDTNKNILSNSKAIKVYAKEKQEKEDELLAFSALPYHEQCLKFLKSILKYYEDQLDQYNLVGNKYREMLRFKTAIDTFNNDLKNITIELSCIKYQLSIFSYLNSVQDIFNMHNELTSISNNIMSCKRLQKWLIVVLSLMKQLRQWKNECNLYSTIIYSYNRLNDIQNEMTTSKASLDKCNVFIQYGTETKKLLKDILIYIGVLRKDIDNTVPLYNKYNDISNNKIAVYKLTLQQCDESINNNTKKMQELVAQQEQLIKDNNICPCCGQKISANKYIKNINEFMKGR